MNASEGTLFGTLRTSGRGGVTGDTLGHAVLDLTRLVTACGVCPLTARVAIFGRVVFTCLRFGTCTRRIGHAFEKVRIARLILSTRLRHLNPLLTHHQSGRRTRFGSFHTRRRGIVIVRTRHTRHGQHRTYCPQLFHIFVSKTTPPHLPGRLTFSLIGGLCATCRTKPHAVPPYARNRRRFQPDNALSVQNFRLFLKKLNLKKNRRTFPPSVCIKFTRLVFCTRNNRKGFIE